MDIFKKIRSRSKKRQSISQIRGGLHGLIMNARSGPRNRGDLDPTIKKYAAFAQSSYVRRRDDKESKLSKHLGDNHGYTLDRNLTNKHMSVWVNEDEKEVVTSFRGTNVKDAEDLATDAHIAVGLENMSQRFRRSEREFKTVLDHYDGFNHVLASHSLGATLNTRMAHVYRDQVTDVHNYNPGSSVSAVLSGLKNKITGTDNSHIHTYHVAYDPISMLAAGDTSHDVHIIDPLRGSVNAHSLDQFLK